MRGARRECGIFLKCLPTTRAPFAEEELTLPIHPPPHRYPRRSPWPPRAPCTWPRRACCRRAARRPSRPTCWPPSGRWACCRSTPSTWWRAAPTWCCGAGWATIRSRGWSSCWPRARCSNTGRTRPASCRSKTMACTATACSTRPPWAGSIRSTGWREQGDDVAAVLEHIRANGAARSSDFERSGWPGRRLVELEAGKALARSAVHLGRADDRQAPQVPALLRPGRTRAAGLARRLAAARRAGAPAPAAGQREGAGPGAGQLDQRLLPHQTARASLAHDLQALVDEGALLRCTVDGWDRCRVRACRACGAGCATRPPASWRPP